MIIKTGRAWNGKLANIDELLIWMYDNVMTTTDQNQKSAIFRRYYRYYNDGDMPRGKDFYSRNPLHSIEDILELQVEKFIKRMLKKYHGKYSRQEFMKYKKQKNYQTIVNMAERYDVSSLDYFGKNIKDEKILEMISEITDLDKDIRVKTRALIDIESKNKPDLRWCMNHITSSQMSSLENQNVEIPEDIKLEWKNIKLLSDKIKSSAELCKANIA